MNLWEFAARCVELKFLRYASLVVMAGGVAIQFICQYNIYAAVGGLLVFFAAIAGAEKVRELLSNKENFTLTLEDSFEHLRAVGEKDIQDRRSLTVRVNLDNVKDKDFPSELLWASVGTLINGFANEIFFVVCWILVQLCIWDPASKL